MTYRIINHYDEQNRMTRLPDYYLNGKTGQLNSHGYSYLYVRKQYQEMGDVMGFDDPEFIPFGETIGDKLNEN